MIQIYMRALKKAPCCPKPENERTEAACAHCSCVHQVRAARTRCSTPSITHFDDTERAILAADVALRTRQAWCAAVLACFKHACSSAPELQAVQGRWAALNARLSDEITAIVKTSVMSDKERASWVSYQEWCAAEERLARDEYGSQRHLLVALSCRVPPARGGDYGLVHIVAPDSPLAADDHTNVLLWGQASQPSTILLKRHKTWRLKGTLSKPLPPSVVAAHRSDNLFLGWSRIVARVFNLDVTLPRRVWEESPTKSGGTVSIYCDVRSSSEPYLDTCRRVSLAAGDAKVRLHSADNLPLLPALRKPAAA